MKGTASALHDIAEAVQSSAQLRLETATEEHAEALFTAYDTQELFTYNTLNHLTSPHDALKFLHSCQRNLASGTHLHFVIFDQQHKCLGTTAVYNPSEDGTEIWMGYTWLSQSVHGTGVNTELKTYLLNTLFNTCGIEKVWFNVDVLNLQSQRAVEKLGAHRARTVKQKLIRKDGTPRESHQYFLTQEMHTKNTSSNR